LSTAAFGMICKVMPVEYRRALEEMARQQVLDRTGLGEIEIGLRAGANGK